MPVKKATTKPIRFHMRFASDSHYSVVYKAAKRAGLSVNAWLVDRSTIQARKELKPS